MQDRLQLPVRTTAERIAAGRNASKIERPVTTSQAMAQRDTSALKRSF